MATEYMDYGIIYNPKGNNVLPRTEVDYTKRGQVYYSTHEGEGQSLSFTDKAFISFTYGDRKIEDFGLIAVTVNDRLDRQTPPDHEDHVTEYKMLHGQYYWGSHYNAREMDITLATDGMTQDQLDNFKAWFRAGEIRELILSQHPNRAIMARVREAPRVSVIPFKREKHIKIPTSEFVNDSFDFEERIIHVTEYKGNIELSFVMDEPFWYAKQNVLGKYIQDKNTGETVVVDEWLDANGNEVNILDNEDALRIVEEDHIPTASMFKDRINLADELQLQPYDGRKYTIGLQDGAPIVNNESGMGTDGIYNYSLNGAVVGPLMKKIYQDNQKLDFSNASYLEEYIFNNQGQLYKPNEDRYAESFKTSRFTLLDYYPIKKGSSIACKSLSTDLQNLITVMVSEYRIENDSYIYEQTMSINHTNTYIATENKNIRISISLQNSIFQGLSTITIIENNQIITINKDEPLTYLNLLELNLLAFNEKEGGITVSNNMKKDPLYFYSGTAPSAPEIEFTIPISFDQNGYVNTFSNEYSLHSNQKPYNILKLCGEEEHVIKLTNPDIFNSYNKVIFILRELSTNRPILEVIQNLRDSVGHYGVRSWVINCINVYYINKNQRLTSSTNLTMTDEARNQILSYMPYFFMTADEADLDLTNISEEPQSLPRTFQQLDGAALIRSDSNEFPLSSDNKAIKVVEGEGFQIEVERGDSRTDITNYSWEYSNDGAVWHPLTLDSQWQGIDTYKLTCKSVTSFDFGKNLRCMISNNKYYQQAGESVIIERLQDLTSITNEAELVIKNKAAGTIEWTVQGEYQNNQNLKPQLYYVLVGSNSQWQLYDNSDDITDYIQSQNGLEYIKTSELSKVKFQFTTNISDDNYFNKIQFKLRLYKRSADSAAISSHVINIDYIESNPITVEIQHFNIHNISMQWIETYEGETKELNEPIIVKPTANLTLKIDNTQYMARLRLQQYNVDTWQTIHEFNNQNELIEHTWYNLSSEMTIRLQIIGMGYATLNSQELETFNYPLSDQEGENVIQINIQSIDSDLNTWLQELKKPMTYSIKKNDTLIADNNYKFYKDEEITCYAFSYVPLDNQLPDDTKISAASVEYTWYVKNSDNNWESIHYQSVSIYANEAYQITNKSSVDSYSFDISEIENNIGPLGNDIYIKCIANLKVKDKETELIISKPLNPDEQKLHIEAYNKFHFTNGTGAINGWKYYVSTNKMYDQNNNQVNINSNWEWQITYDINGDYRRDTLQWKQGTVTNNGNITWANIGNAQNPDQGQASYSYSGFSDATNFYDSINNKCIQCTILGALGDTVQSQPLWFNISEVNIEDIPLGDRIPSETIVSWVWPIQNLTVGKVKKNVGRYVNGQYQYYQTQVDDIIYTDSESTQSLSYTWNSESKQYIFSGRPGKAQYIAANDGYTLQAGINTYQSNKETTLTLLTIPCQTYSDIQLSLGLSNFSSRLTQNFKYRLFLSQQSSQSQSQVQEQTLTSTNNTISIKISDLDAKKFTKTRDIELKLSIYYNTNAKWPNTIGYYEYPTNASNYSALFSDTFKTNHLTYTQENIPSLSTTSSPTIKLITLSGIRRVSIEDEVTNTEQNDNIDEQQNSGRNSAPLMLEMNQPTPMNLRFSAFNSPKNVDAAVNNSPIKINPNSHYIIKINNATGQYVMTTKYNIIKWPAGLVDNLFEDNKNICYVSSLRNNEVHTFTQNVGNMILSNNLIFEQQNHFDSNNIIQPWSKDDPTLSHKLTYDGDIPLQNFKLTYKNYYL